MLIKKGNTHGFPFELHCKQPRKHVQMVCKCTNLAGQTHQKHNKLTRKIQQPGKWFTRPHIVRSWRKHKKLAVKTPRGWVHFGDTRYKDFTEHRDQVRRKRYLTRAAGIVDQYGRKTINNVYSPNYWSARVLWKK